MLEAGFTMIDVYKEVAIAPEETPRPVQEPSELGDDYAVVVVGR
jgi:hypothetical protein